MRNLSAKHLFAFGLVLIISVEAQAQSGSRGAASQGSGMRSVPAPSAPSRSYQTLHA